MNIFELRTALERLARTHECMGEHAFAPPAIDCPLTHAVIKAGLRWCFTGCDGTCPHECGNCAGLFLLEDVLRDAAR